MSDLASKLEAMVYKCYGDKELLDLFRDAAKGLRDQEQEIERLRGFPAEWFLNHVGATIILQRLITEVDGEHDYEQRLAADLQRALNNYEERYEIETLRADLALSLTTIDSLTKNLGEQQGEIERLRAENADLRARGKIREEAVPRLYEEIERLRAAITQWINVSLFMGSHRTCACAACCRLREVVSDE